MPQVETLIHLCGGGVGGTVGAIATCPLEVVKTRLQSSVATFHHVYIPPISPSHSIQPHVQMSTFTSYQTLTISPNRPPAITIWRCLRHIVETEGVGALFKGLGPNLVGVAPSRAIYFCTYSNSKKFFNERLPADSPIVHMCSAVCAGVAACSATNPIWFVKTRLQLDQSRDRSITARQCIRDIYRRYGPLGFYKGITASYFGVSETVIHFVIYEAVKARFRELRQKSATPGEDDEKSTRDFVEFMCAGAISKSCASCIAYPHEVARTRLREEGNKYRSFWQTLALVFKEEGHRGLYRGLATQLVRQIPNTAIMMATYEAVVYCLHQQLSPPRGSYIDDDTTDEQDGGE